MIARLKATSGSEWIKLWSVRSGPVALAATALILVLGGLTLGAGYRSGWATMGRTSRTDFDPTYITLRGIDAAQLLIGGLGVLTVTGEYATGLIRATMAATPQRAQVIAIKALIFAGIVWALATAACLAAFVIGQSQLTSPAAHAWFGDPGVLRAVLGGGIYLTMAGLFGVVIGTLLRSTALSLAALFGVLIVLPIVVSMVGGETGKRVGEYLPGTAGEQIWHVLRPAGDSLGPWQGAAVFALYLAVAAAGAIFAIRGRDVR